MALKSNKMAAATAVAAAFSMLATPVAAVELPHTSAARAYDGSAETVQRHRRWRDRDRIDAGDVLAGVLILGGIAAIASAAEKRNRADRYPAPYPDDEVRYRTPRGYDGPDSRGMERAVDMCANEVERRGDRVGSVDGANRNRDGWQVSGQLENGAAWSCWIGNDGRISDVEVGGEFDAGYAEPADGQWSDDDYARARERQRSAQPAIDGEPGDDGRYDMARSAEGAL